MSRRSGDRFLSRAGDRLRRFFCGFEVELKDPSLLGGLRDAPRLGFL